MRRKPNKPSPRLPAARPRWQSRSLTLAALAATCTLAALLPATADAGLTSPATRVLSEVVRAPAHEQPGTVSSPASSSELPAPAAAVVGTVAKQVGSVAATVKPPAQLPAALAKATAAVKAAPVVKAVERATTHGEVTGVVGATASRLVGGAVTRIADSPAGAAVNAVTGAGEEIVKRHGSTLAAVISEPAAKVVAPIAKGPAGEIVGPGAAGARRPAPPAAAATAQRGGPSIGPATPIATAHDTPAPAAGAAVMEAAGEPPQGTPTSSARQQGRATRTTDTASQRDLAALAQTSFSTALVSGPATAASVAGPGRDVDPMSTTPRPAPVPSPGGVSPATGAGTGFGASIFLTLAGLRMLAAPRARRRLLLAVEPWRAAPFLQIPQRPG